MKILVLNWGAYTQRDISTYFQKEGITLDIVDYPMLGKDKNINDAFTALFSAKIKEGNYDAAFSVNYFPVLSRICHKYNLIYLSWSYDAPLNVRNIEETLSFETNRAFFFDRLQALEYQQKGIAHIYHLPLGIPSIRLISTAKKRAENVNSAFNFSETDISFVGNLYSSPFQKIISPLTLYQQGYLDGMVKSQLNLYGAFLLNLVLTDDFIQSINKEYQKNVKQPFAITREELVYTLATEVTFEERQLLLGLLSTPSENYHPTVTLCSKEVPSLLKNVFYHKPVDYYSEMPLVFANSKINLNITHKMLQSGIPLRALDIFGCGGFLLSNYQPELCEYFIPGEDFACYESVEDAYEQAAFYLKHDELRLQIAKSGRQKAQENFDYPVLLKRMFALAGLTP